MGGFIEYFGSGQNYVDIAYILLSVANVALCNLGDNPYTLANKILLIIIFLMQIVRSFNILRIFDNLSYIVVMIYQVFYDLKVFLIFYSILLIFFSLTFAVIQVENKKHGDLKK